MRRYIISKKVGRKIRIIRKQRGLTQEDIADKSGMHVSTLGRIERGESNPPLQTLNKIAQVLKVKPREILP
jgi:transcriptional regulator with XRE-family HTH domain